MLPDIYPDSVIREDVYRKRFSLSVGTQVEEFSMVEGVPSPAMLVERDYVTACLDVVSKDLRSQYPRLYRLGAAYVCEKAGAPIPKEVAFGGDIEAIAAGIDYALGKIASANLCTPDAVRRYMSEGWLPEVEQQKPAMLARKKIGSFTLIDTEYSVGDIMGIKVDANSISVDIIGMPKAPVIVSNIDEVAGMFNAIIEQLELNAVTGGYIGLEDEKTAKSVEVEGKSVIAEALFQAQEAVKEGDIGKAGDIMTDAVRTMRFLPGRVDSGELRSLMAMMNSGMTDAPKARVSLFDPDYMAWALREYNEGVGVSGPQAVSCYDEIPEHMKETLYNRYVEEM